MDQNALVSLAPSNMLMNVVFQEEQADDETYEQFEERVVNKRAGQMFLSIKRRLRNNNILFSDLVHQNNRKQVSAVETERESKKVMVKGRER